MVEKIIDLYHYKLNKVVLFVKLKFPNFSGALILENANFRRILVDSNMFLRITRMFFKKQ
jgi:hypothetical protein